MSGEAIGSSSLQFHFRLISKSNFYRVGYLIIEPKSKLIKLYRTRTRKKKKRPTHLACGPKPTTLKAQISKPIGFGHFVFVAGHPLRSNPRSGGCYGGGGGERYAGHTREEDVLNRRPVPPPPQLRRPPLRRARGAVLGGRPPIPARPPLGRREAPLR